MKIGYFLSSEEFGPRDLVAQAVKAQEAGFRDLWISDHFHPWNDEQGHSSFVWATIGAIAQAAPGMGVTTAVTCPTMRIHPAVIAHAAATAALLLEEKHVAAIRAYEDAGFDELYIQQIGPNQDEFFKAYGQQVLPHVRDQRRLAHASS